MTGALFFKPGVNLYIEKNGILKGGQDITRLSSNKNTY